jgi:hypothetical protein
MVPLISCRLRDQTEFVLQSQGVTDREDRCQGLVPQFVRRYALVEPPVRV